MTRFVDKDILEKKKKEIEKDKLIESLREQGGKMLMALVEGGLA